MERERVFGVIVRRLIVVEAAAAICLARALLSVLPFRAVARLAGAPAAPAHAPADGETLGSRENLKARNVARAVAGALKTFRLRTGCLPQALGAGFMLRHRGVPAIVRFGVRHGDDGFAAHAWITAGGITVAGGASAPDFVPVVDFRSTSGERRNFRH